MFGGGCGCAATPFFIGMCMSTCLINPVRHRGEPNLPTHGILAVNPSDRASFAALAKECFLHRHGLFNAELYCNDRLFLAGPAVGAPMAVLCLEKLIALGARRIVLYGWCGSLAQSLRIGDLFMPTDALSEEGTSAHYQPTPLPIVDTLHRDLLKALIGLGHAPRQGMIWTTDAVYRETREKVASLGARGILAVDMEYAALRTVAAFRGVSLAAVLLVSDELSGAAWRSGYGQPAFRRQSRTLLAQLATLLSSRVDQLP